MMGAARLTRYSFSRTMLRRAVRGRWRARQARFDVDDRGHGEAVYEIDAGGHKLSFVAFTTTIDESEHTDRVIAERWEIAAALVEGDLTGEFLNLLRRHVPLQEAGRFDPRSPGAHPGQSQRAVLRLPRRCPRREASSPTLIWWPTPATSCEAPRSTPTASTGCGHSRDTPTDHPLRVPYRAQFVCAWLFRELGYDLVEHCARAKGGAAAVPFDEQWRRYFGLGNATGLGLVPFAFKHPRVIHAWVSIREMALADVRALPGNRARLERLDAWIQRAHAHFVHGTDDDCRPFLNSVDVATVVLRVREAFDRCRRDPLPFDALYRWSESDGPETAELVVSLLLEMHDGDDELIDEMLTVDEHSPLDPALTVGHMRTMLASRFEWLGRLDLDDESADEWWWVISDNTEEPRRTRRDRLEPAGRDVAIDVALRLWRLQGRARRLRRRDADPSCYRRTPRAPAGG